MYQAGPGIGTVIIADPGITIGGTDRYATSLAIAEYFGMNSDASTACVTTGQNYPDALAGSVYAAQRRAPVILADGSLSEQAVKYFESAKVNEAAIFGGSSAVGQNIEQKLREAIGK